MAVLSLLELHRSLTDARPHLCKYFSPILQSREAIFELLRDQSLGCDVGLSWYTLQSVSASSWACCRPGAQLLRKLKQEHCSSQACLGPHRVQGWPGDLLASMRTKLKSLGPRVFCLSQSGGHVEVRGQSQELLVASLLFEAVSLVFASLPKRT